MIAAGLVQICRAGQSENCTDENSATAATKLEFIRVNSGSDGFVAGESGAKFVAWGVNYDHDGSGRLLEDYWQDEWATVVEDFKEIRALRANVVRIHLQVAKFMDGPAKPNKAALARLGQLVKLAERTELYLDITGLGCYHKQDVPQWYDALDEAKRWEAQEVFWEAVAKTCAPSAAVFCYDLMNEPVVSGQKKEAEWLADPLGDKHFVQRISLDSAGRTQKQIAKAWVDKLVAAIRKHDKRHMVTVGVIPWVLSFPTAKPLFYSEEVCENLDFASVHFYPEKDKIDEALTALAAYDIGKPLVIEEIFSLKCGLEEMDAFIDGSREFVDGYISFYWGKTIEEYSQEKDNLVAILMKIWLEYFQAKQPEIVGAGK